MPIAPASLWTWLPFGYALSVAIEAPVLLAVLTWPRPGPGSSRQSAVGSQEALLDPPSIAGVLGRRCRLAAWLTAVTYPMVVVVLPLALPGATSWPTYFVIAEAFAIATECALFQMTCRPSWRDVVVVALANVISATVGVVMLA